MKIIIVSSFFPTSSSDKLPLFLLEQAKYLAKTSTDYEITIVTTKRVKKDNNSELPGNITIKRFSYMPSAKYHHLTNLGIIPAIKDNPLNLLQLPLLFFFESLAIFQAIRSIKPDYIYSHWFLPQGLICYFLTKLFKTPHLFTSHSNDVEICNKIPLIGRPLARNAMKSIHAGTAVSNRTLNSIKNLFSKSEWETVAHKFITLPMGIAAKNPTIANSKNYRHILFMGRFAEKKGVTFLIQALSKLTHKYPELKLTIAGDGPLKEKIEQEVKSLQLQNHINLPGFITKEQKEDLLNECGVFVLPSIVTENGDREGLPVSLLENMSYGNICIATDVSGAEEILEDGINGFLCISKDGNELAGVIEKAITTQNTQIKLIQNQSRKTAQQYSWDNITKKQNRHFFERQISQT